MEIRSERDLRVFQLAYKFAMEIFEISKSFPPEERFALTGQIRRSSRSVCMNLGEAWAKRRYELHFVSKLTDCDGENNETGTSLLFARDCGYLHPDVASHILEENREIGRMLGAMIKNPHSFLLRL